MLNTCLTFYLASIPFFPSPPRAAHSFALLQKAWVTTSKKKTGTTLSCVLGITGSTIRCWLLKPIPGQFVPVFYSEEMNSCFIGCITLFIPLNCESDKAVLGLPELGGTLWCSGCSPIWQGKLMSELPDLSPCPFPSPRDCLRTGLPPPISAGKRISACSEGHHLRTPSRGHSWPKLTLTLRHLLTWICWTVWSSSQRVTCSLPGDCKKLVEEAKLMTVTAFSNIIHQRELNVSNTMYRVHWKCKLVVPKQITLQDQH